MQLKTFTEATVWWKGISTWNNEVLTFYFTILYMEVSWNGATPKSLKIDHVIIESYGDLGIPQWNPSYEVNLSRTSVNFQDPDLPSGNLT